MLPAGGARSFPANLALRSAGWCGLRRLLERRLAHMPANTHLQTQVRHTRAGAVWWFECHVRTQDVKQSRNNELRSTCRLCLHARRVSGGHVDTFMLTAHQQSL